MADKVTKAELKQPDRFQLLLASTLNFLILNKKKLILGGVIFLTLILIVSGWLYYRHDQEEKALVLLNRATATYERAVMQSKISRKRPISIAKLRLAIPIRRRRILPSFA